MISFNNIESAYTVLKPVVHKTPLLSSRTFNQSNGNEVYFKAENFQRIGAFKFRGAYNKLNSLTNDEHRRGVIAHSSGNHAQGVALASKLFGTKAVIVMPHDSVKSKVDATKSYGAEIVFCGTATGDRERTTDELLRKHGYTLVHPYNDEKLIAGQGTVALEIFHDCKELDYLFVPIGGGGLIAGCALAAKNLFPSIQVIGVEPEGANDCYQSFRQQRIVTLDDVRTIADGVRTRSVGPINFEIIQRYVDDVITIKDDDMYPMMKFFYERMKIVVEPSAAVPFASVLNQQEKFAGARVGIILSGGNVDLEKAAKWFS